MAADAGMGAILLKDHFEPTVSRAYHASRAVPEIKVFGGIVLNRYIGGLNPFAVEVAMRTGAKQVWMPTVDAQRHVDTFGSTGTYQLKGKLAGPPVKSSPRLQLTHGLSILANDELLTEVKEIVEIVGEHDGILGTGHLSDAEVLKLAEHAHAVGFRKLLITHIDWSFVRGFDTDGLKKLVSLGAALELCATCIYPPTFAIAIDKVVAWINAIGPKHFIISTDYGAPVFPAGPEVLRAYVQCLNFSGISKADIKTMTTDNPARWLNL